MQSPEASWHDQLETIGADLFLRYRKRLHEPGILWTMRAEHPGLSLPDLWFRLRAGRQLLAERNDFRALEAVRSGEWQRLLQQRRARRADDRRGDGTSRVLVRLGEVLAVVFGLLTLTAWLPLDSGPWGIVGPAAIVYLLWRRRRSWVDHLRRRPVQPPAWPDPVQ